jgi:Ca2+-binding EF-hand superfamily protein
MEVSDTDRSGFIDRSEFQEFFMQIKSLVVSSEEVNQIFDEFDESGDNRLSVEEFAKAIMRFFITEGEEDFSIDEEDESMENEDDE